MIEYISSAFMPVLILIIFIFAVYKKVDLYEAFIEGSKGGLHTVLRIFPFLLTMLFAVNILMSCGILTFIGENIKKILPFFNFEPQLFAMAFLRPFSGSAGTAVLTNIYQTFTPDSFVGLTASIMMGSTDATLYIMSMYYGNAGIKDARYSLKAGLTADAIGLSSAIVISYLLFH